MSATSKNDKPQTSVSALSNPFSTGGGGVDFEHRVQATFLLALLVEGFSPLLNLPITSVLFQAKRSGYDTDDIVLFSSSDTYSAKFTRLHNDSNVLCMGARVLGAGLALEIVDMFINTDFEGGRHQLRVDMITALEDKLRNN